MAYTLSNLLRDALSETTYLKYGRATSGSTTTLTDTNRPTGEDAQAFIGGTLFVLRDAGGASAAPEGEFSRITAYTNNQFTIADTLTVAIGAGDRYGVSTNTFVHEELLELANDALRRFDLSLTDTSLTTAASQTEYDLPVGLKLDDIQRVEYQGNTNDSDDNRWIDVLDYETNFTAPGSVAKLKLPQLSEGRTIRLTYSGRHPIVNAYNDPIAEVIHPVLARASLAERLANRLTEKTKSSAPPFTRGYDKASAKLEEAMVRYPIRRQATRAKLLII